MNWENDWPVINGGEKIPLEYAGPQLYQWQPPVAWRDDFTQPQLQLGWYRKNTPVLRDFSLTAREGCLRLYGGPYNLSVPTCPTLFLRKQTHRVCTWETRVSFESKQKHTEAGTVVWWNYLTYSSMGVQGSDTGGRMVRFQPAQGDAVEIPLQNAQSDVIFVVECGPSYRFGFREAAPDGDQTRLQWVGDVGNDTMTRPPRVGAAFTGMMLGVYAFGERQRCLAPADFHYAMWR